MQKIYNLLPIMMISKKNVNGHKVNYEEYLIELLNASLNFMKITKSENFREITKQSNGECDAEAGDYQIDFKLLVPTDFMQYKTMSLPNIDYKNIKHGFISVNDNKNSLDETLKIKANNAFVNYIGNLCLKNKEELLNIKDKESILKSSINNMLVNKNILAFIPCTFDDKTDGMSFIKKIFGSLLSIRDDLNKNTFITFLQGDYFYIIQYDNGEYILFDKVHKIMLPTFNDLYKLTYLV